MVAFDKSILEEASRDLAAIAGSRVMAFDVFYYYQQQREEQQYHVESYSFGDPAYVKKGGHLDTFIKTYGTLSRTERPDRIDGTIPSISILTQNTKPAFEHHEYDWSDDSFLAAKQEDLIEFLGSKNFGKHFFLITVHQNAANVEVRFSTFVVFANAPKDEAATRNIRDALTWLMLSKLSNAITSLLSRKRDFYQEFLYLASIRTNRMSHVIGNIPIQASIAAVYFSLEERDYEKAMRCLKSLDNLELIRSHATDLLCDINPNSQRSAIHHEGITTYDAILKTFHESHANRDGISFSGIDSIANHPANIIPLDNLTSVFILLWNIWVNWSEAHLVANATFLPSLTVTSTEKDFSLKFENAGVMTNDLVLYMNDKSVCSNPSPGQGTTDIKEIAESLLNVIVFYETTESSTITTVAIKN